jgi:predicted GIY-YIG superfamily endonuclease
MNTYYVYWLHLLEHSDLTCEGYIGVSKDPYRRLLEHKNTAKKGYNQNPYLGRVLNKYNQQVLQTIIFQGTEQECYQQEENIRPNKNIGWNANKGGIKPPNMLGIPRSEETKKKISKKLKGHVQSFETRCKISKKNKLRIVSPETRKKLSIFFKGKKRPEEVKIKISQALKGRKGIIPSREKREHLSKLFKNRYFSDETRAKISQSKKKYWANIRSRSNLN